MNNNTDILNELRIISPFMAGMEKTNVFTVPQGYFDGLPSLLAKLVKEDDHGTLASISRLNTHEVPEGYFSGLADNILGRIRAQQTENATDELRALSPMLYSIQNENVYQVPKDYFAGLSEDILSKLQQPKVVTMRRRSSTFVKYAVAAAFTGVMALGVFKFLAPAEMKQTQPGYVTAGLQMQNSNVDEELAKVSDEDIIKYLAANNENIDAQTVASKTLNESELPSQADYIMDDQALDKYLDNINTNETNN